MPQGPKVSGTPVERLKREMHRALDTIRSELNRVEVLAAAMRAFSAPVPDYEAGFQHLPQARLRHHKLS